MTENINNFQRGDLFAKNFRADADADADRANYLSPREVDCLTWYAKGKTSAEIALILTISRRTVETHIQHAKEKLACTNLFQLGYCIAKMQFQYFGFVPNPY